METIVERWQKGEREFEVNDISDLIYILEVISDERGDDLQIEDYDNPDFFVSRILVEEGRVFIDFEDGE